MIYQILEQMKILLPLFILFFSPIIILILTMISATHRAILIFSLCIDLAVFGGIFYFKNVTMDILNTFSLGLFKFDTDNSAFLFLCLVLASGFIIKLFSFTYIEKSGDKSGEFYFLLSLSILGASLITISAHLVSFFLSLELLSISLYALIAYFRKHSHGLEASIKYLVLTVSSDAFLLMGFSLIFAASGSLTLPISNLEVLLLSNNVWLLTGLALSLVGLGFKLGIVPFHVWVGDVYKGSPLPITMLIATVAKGGVFAFLIKLFNDKVFINSDLLVTVFSIISICSMVFGNFLALRENNLKRILAYSSIANFGYLMIPLLAYHNAPNIMFFYLTSYFAANLATFGALSVLSVPISGGEVDVNIEDIKGLAWRRPFLAIILSVAILSLAGIPVTIGFFAKFFVISLGIMNGLWILIGALIINSLIGIYYYLRVLISICSSEPREDFQRTSYSNAISLALLLFVILFFGFFPNVIL